MTLTDDGPCLEGDAMKAWQAEMKRVRHGRHCATMDCRLKLKPGTWKEVERGTKGFIKLSWYGMAIFLLEFSDMWEIDSRYLREMS